MQPLRLFVGHDHREAAGLHAFISSLLEHATKHVELTILTARVAAELGIGTDGSNSFTKSRFLVPKLCDYKGRALWLDGTDMLMRADIYEILQHFDSSSAVQVVKHDYTPSADTKYIGTEMEGPNIAYPRKNWTSAMVLWCEHDYCRRLTPEYVAKASGQDLHRFAWIDDDECIGELPREWNWLDEYGENRQAKLVHYTNGIPGFSAYREAPHAGEWLAFEQRSRRGMTRVRTGVAMMGEKVASLIAYLRSLAEAHRAAGRYGASAEADEYANALQQYIANRELAG